MTAFVLQGHVFGAQSTKLFASAICLLPNSEFEVVQIHGPKPCIGADKVQGLFIRHKLN